MQGVIRRIGFGLGLLVIFFASYVFAERWAPQGAQWLIVVPVFFITFIVILARQRRGFEEINDAYAVMCEGRIVESLATFEAIKQRLNHAAPLFYVGHAQLLLWRVADAAATFEQFVKRSGALSGVPGGERLVAPSVALAHALLGNAQAAEVWLEKCPGPPTARLAELVLACRAGDRATAARLLQQHDAVLDQLGGTHRALCEALTAFVGVPGGRVDATRLFRESSVGTLKPVWPELHTFVLSEIETEKSAT